MKVTVKYSVAEPANELTCTANYVRIEAPGATIRVKPDPEGGLRISTEHGIIVLYPAATNLVRVVEGHF